MGRRLPWMVAMGGLVVAGCTGLPDYAVPRNSLAMDISSPLPQVARSQMSDVPLPLLQKPLAPPPEPQPTPASGPAVMPASFANRGTVRVSVRAWVNGRPIFTDEVMQMAGPEIRRVIGASPESQRDEKLAELMNKVVDDLVDQELMYQDAVKKLEKVNPKALDRLKEYVDREVEKSIDRMRKADVPEDQIRQAEPAARRMMERNIISGEYARSRIMPTLQSLVGLTQIREYYESHLDDFKAKDRVVWQDIFIPVSPNLPTVEDAKRFAEDLINKCRRADDFNQLMVYNEGDSKLRGGEGLGQKRGEIRPVELEDVLFQLREGEIGPVIAFSTGVHLVRVTKREYAGQLPLNDETQKIIRKTLEGQLFEREYRRLVRELRQRAVVRLERD